MNNHLTLARGRRLCPGAAHGFSMVELLVALSILILGLLATATMVLGGLVAGLQSQDLAVANQLAKEAMEGVFTARIQRSLPFTAIQNQSQGGIFRDGYQPINFTGTDGLVNTNLYSTQPPLFYIDPGRDNTYDTADDKTIRFLRFAREIRIENVPADANLRRITVNVQVTSKGITSQAASLATVISPIN